MATEKLYRPAAPFVWVDPRFPDSMNVLHEGLVFDGDHPAVRAKPSCFVELTADNAKPDAERVLSPQIEQATRAPGEKRSYVRRTP